MITRRQALLAAILYPSVRSVFWLACLGVAVLSLLPVAAIPSGLNFWDKAQHTMAFTGLTLLGLWSYLAHRNKVLLGLWLFGAVIELAQAMTTWREGDAMDWVADGLGIALGFGVCQGMRIVFQRLACGRAAGRV